jgi:hypothetical protein
MIEQTGITETSTTLLALETATAAVNTELSAVADTFDPMPGEAVFVPDTNAIVWNPNLESWSFKDVKKFSIILTSTVLSELDDLKMKHRSDSVRETAESAIRRFKEYARRGNIHGGRAQRTRTARTG